MCIELQKFSIIFTQLNMYTKLSVKPTILLITMYISLLI